MHSLDKSLKHAGECCQTLGTGYPDLLTALQGDQRVHPVIHVAVQTVAGHAVHAEVVHAQPAQRQHEGLRLHLQVPAAVVAAAAAGAVVSAVVAAAAPFLRMMDPKIA